MTARAKLRLGIPLAICMIVMFGFLAGCNVAESYRVSLVPGETANKQTSDTVRCSTEAGSYSLSMTTWQFEISKYPASAPFLDNLTPISHPDTHFTYCLDYVANAFADDTLSVSYATGPAATPSASGMLNYVASYAVDQSATVIRKLIRAIFVVLSRSPDFNPRAAVQTGDPVLLGRFEVDPLDAEEMAAVNDRIKSFGFCLVLDDYSFEMKETSPEAYCSNPHRISSNFPSQKLAHTRQKRWLREKPDRGGILYRPRLPYGLSVYTKDDAGGPGTWQLRETKTVYLENLSPIVSLGLNRVAFAKSRIGLEFDNGVLKNFCLARSGSVRGIVEIPLDIVYGVVSLPSVTIKAEIDRASKSQLLLDAEDKLLVAQGQFIEFEKNKGAAKPNISKGTGAIITGTTGCGTGGCSPPPTITDQSGEAAFISPGVCDDIAGELPR